MDMKLRRKNDALFALVVNNKYFVYLQEEEERLQEDLYTMDSL
jgi:hypothetical protein